MTAITAEQDPLSTMTTPTQNQHPVKVITAVPADQDSPTTITMAFENHEGTEDHNTLTSMTATFEDQATLTSLTPATEDHLHARNTPVSYVSTQVGPTSASQTPLYWTWLLVDALLITAILLLL